MTGEDTGRARSADAPAGGGRAGGGTSGRSPAGGDEVGRGPAGDEAAGRSPVGSDAVRRGPAGDEAAGRGPAGRETVGAAVRRLTARFGAAGIDGPRLDAELLVADAIGGDRARLFLSPDRVLSPEQAARVAAHERGRAVRRASVAHLLGVRGFRRLDLTVDERVLIPRPETELLVELGLELPLGATVVDVGTGSGAIALALADERPDLVIHATDVSAAALEVARENARRLGSAVAFHEGDLLEAVPAGVGSAPVGVGGAAGGVGGASAEVGGAAGRVGGASAEVGGASAGVGEAAGGAGEAAAEVGGSTAASGPDAPGPGPDAHGREALDRIRDGRSRSGGARRTIAVLSNPPYVPDGDLGDLPPEVADHDPHLALFGGPDGLDVVRRLLPAAHAFGATLVGVEIGRGQAEATAALARAAGFAETEIRDDLAGIGRVVVGRRADR